jgi:aspartate ammonia-lyase
MTTTTHDDARPDAPEGEPSPAGSSSSSSSSLTPYIGYAAAAAIAHTALTTNAPIARLVVAAGLMSEAQVQKVLSPARLSGLEAVTSAIPIIDVDDPAAAVARAANTAGVRNPGDETAG